MVPSLTETLYELGLDEQVVGITRYCEEPPHWLRHKALVGGTKLRDPRPILDLAPDLVILNKEENLLPLAQALETMNVPLLVTFPRTLDEAEGTLLEMATATQTLVVGEQLMGEIRELRHQLAQRTIRPFRYLCFIWKSPFMTIGDDTFMHAMLAAIGGVNAAASLARGRRYFTVTDSEIAALLNSAEAPELVLFPDEPYPFATSDIEAFAAAFPNAAGRPRRLAGVSGKALSWYGSGMRRGLRWLNGFAERLS